LTQITAASSLALRSGRLGSPAVAGPLLRSPLAVWAAIWLNVLAFVGQAPIIPIPGIVGQAITQGALLLALFLALLVNPAVVIRPNLVLILLSTMALFAFLASLHSEFLVGSTYRGIRLMIFVTVLWLLTPWWGRPDLPLLRAHIKILRVVVGSVIVGAIAWGPAHGGQGRLQGTLWPMPPPQVAHYAAVLLGCTAVLWFTGLAGRRTMLFTLIAGGYALIDSHTRTPLAALVLGLIVAGASLFVGHARVRRTAVTMTALTGFVVALFAPYLVAWLSRGQSAQDAAQLTGRTKVWSKVISEQRSHLHLVFGDGLSNKSFDGLPIDSNWVATYLDQGLLGAGLIVAFLLVLLMTALTRPRGPQRAIALFLVTYCIVVSFTETGLGDASPYLLDICVAASVLALPTGERAT
jgi:hypothetical protein